MLIPIDTLFFQRKYRKSTDLDIIHWPALANHISVASSAKFRGLLMNRLWFIARAVQFESKQLIEEKLTRNPRLLPTWSTLGFYCFQFQANLIIEQPGPDDSVLEKLITLFVIYSNPCTLSFKDTCIQICETLKTYLLQIIGFQAVHYNSK